MTESPGKRLCVLVALLSCMVLLSGCSENWGWYVVDPTTKSGSSNLKFLLGGLYYTVLLSLTAIVISIAAGLLIALPGLGENRVLRGLNRTYVELVRAVPILVLILWVYYGMPQMIGISISVFWAGAIALALSDSAFEAEIFRAGIQSIDRGQYEASHSISLNYVDTMRFVILPQAIRRILSGSRQPACLHAEDVFTGLGNRYAGTHAKGQRAGRYGVPATGKSTRFLFLNTLSSFSWFRLVSAGSREGCRQMRAGSRRNAGSGEPAGGKPKGPAAGFLLVRSMCQRFGIGALSRVDSGAVTG